MERVGADEYYLLDKSYFLRLREALGERLHLFVAEQDGVICSAALFVHTGDIIQYHLSGSDPAYAHFAPSKLVLDEARLWGNAVGARLLHLGGGVGSRRDNLFMFKAGFSLQRHRFYVWKWVVFPKVYSRLVNAWRASLIEGGQEQIATDFFPLYRAKQ
jgi:lipid II:glycine glycyltransferase (peptidoglycan interpeptide bridge formation enzyme)